MRHQLDIVEAAFRSRELLLRDALSKLYRLDAEAEAALKGMFETVNETQTQ